MLHQCSRKCCSGLWVLSFVFIGRLMCCVHTSHPSPLLLWTLVATHHTTVYPDLNYYVLQWGCVCACLDWACMRLCESEHMWALVVCKHSSCFTLLPTVVWWCVEWVNCTYVCLSVCVFQKRPCIWTACGRPLRSHHFPLLLAVFQVSQRQEQDLALSLSLCFSLSPACSHSLFSSLYFQNWCVVQWCVCTKLTLAFAQD